MFDMEVTGADTGQSDPHDGVAVMAQDGLWLVLQFKFSVSNVSTSEHVFSLSY